MCVCVCVLRVCVFRLSKILHPTFILLSLLFSFIYPTIFSGTQSIHSHAAKIEVIIQKILEINTRGDSRINEGERGC